MAEVQVIHMTDVLKQIEVARIYRQLVDISFWSLKDAEKIELKGWQPVHTHWRHPSTVRLFNPKNRQFREVRTITIYKYNGKEVYV